MKSQNEGTSAAALQKQGAALSKPPSDDGPAAAGEIAAP
jgi:hypothetical protein